MTTSRERFLKDKWTPYPLVPGHHNVRGRVDQVRRQYEFSAIWAEILLPRDWISAKSEGTQLKEVLLLSPQISDQYNQQITDDQWSHHLKFQQFLREVRRFFEAEFTEVQTPTLVTCPGTEPYLDVFSTHFSFGARKQKYFLPTSPELHLKRIMAERGEAIFEISKCFRNGEVSDHHQPEFLMLEFYRPFADLEKIRDDVTKLVSHLASFLGHPGPSSMRSCSMAELFFEKLNFKLTPETTQLQLADLSFALKLFPSLESASSQSWDDLFFLIFLEKIERHLIGNELIFLTDYPPSQAALARINERGWGDRFEVYWRGLELGNAFHELNDPKIQALRFEADLDKKREIGKESVPLDLEFLRALEGGMPPSAGIAIGIERLFMALTGHKKLSDFRLFPIAEN